MTTRRPPGRKVRVPSSVGERRVRCGVGGQRLLGRPLPAGLCGPADHRPLRAAHGDRDPADPPVGKAAWVVGQPVVAPNEVLDRGFKPHPCRQALGTRFAQGALMGVAPPFSVVTAAFNRLCERAGTHRSDRREVPASFPSFENRRRGLRSLEHRPWHACRDFNSHGVSPRTRRRRRDGLAQPHSSASTASIRAREVAPAEVSEFTT